MRALAATLIFLTGLLHVLPVSGVLSTERLHALYGVAIADPDLAIFMRHRAVLFGIVAGLLIAAAFRPPLRNVAIAVGLVSMLSFVVIAVSLGGYNAELRRVVAVDALGSLLLVAAAGIERFARRGSGWDGP